MGAAHEGVEKTLRLDASADRGFEIMTKWYKSIDEGRAGPHMLEFLPGINSLKDIDETNGGLDTITVSRTLVPYQHYV